MPGTQDRRSEVGSASAKLLAVVGVVLVVIFAAFTFSGVGATTSRKVSRSVTAVASVPGSGESPAVFLNRLAAAMRNGDVSFMVARLDPAVIARYGSAACQKVVATYKDPTAAFSVQSASSPADYTYTAAGQTSVIPNTITVQGTFTHRGSTKPVTVHVSRTDAGKLTWYTDCSSPPSG